MRTLHYELCALIDNSFFESKKPSVDTDVPACSQHQTSYVENVRFWQMSNLWVFCGFSTRNDGFVKVGDVLFDEVYVLFYFFRFFVLIKGKFFLSLTTWHDNRQPVNTETLYGPSSARINGALLCLHYLIAFTFFFGAENWSGEGKGVKIWEYCLTEICFLGWQDCTLCFRRDSNLIPRVLL